MSNVTSLSAVPRRRLTSSCCSSFTGFRLLTVGERTTRRVNPPPALSGHTHAGQGVRPRRRGQTRRDPLSRQASAGLVHAVDLLAQCRALPALLSLGQENPR